MLEPGRNDSRETAPSNSPNQQTKIKLDSRRNLYEEKTELKLLIWI